MTWGTKRPEHKTAHEVIAECIRWMPQLTAEEKRDRAPSLARQLLGELTRAGYEVRRREGP